MIGEKPPAKEILDEMRAAGMTRMEMAKKLGVNLAKLKRWLSSLEVRPRKTKIAERIARRPYVHERPTYSDPSNDLSLMQKAQINLGNRMNEDHRGYILDGRPANTDQILRAAGLVTKVAKHAPMGKRY